MRLLCLSLIILLTGLVCLQCSKPSSPPPLADLPDSNSNNEITLTDKQTIEASNRFGLKLFYEVNAAQAPGENVFISPLSASLALGMTLNGAADSTRKAMASTLELAGMSPEEINQSYRRIIDDLTGLDPAVAFDIANSIWYKQGFPISADFVDLNRTYFDAQVRGLDFNQFWAIDTINHWVDINTHGKITEIIKEISPDAVMFLINAIYFKGDWTLTFDTALTEEMDFTLGDGSVVTRPIMRTDTLLAYFENDLFQAVDLPYGDRSFSMTVFLPKPSHTPDEIISQLSPVNWAAWIGALSETKVMLGLPKFKFSYEVFLTDILKALGMTIAFDPGAADFSNMVEDGSMLFGNLFISFVKQKTFVQVDEVGTEAAAVTIVGIELTGFLPDEKIMMVTRPFVLAIRERGTGSILFIGKIVDPAWQE